MTLDTETIVALIGLATTVSGYLFGRRKANNEADSAAYKAYAFALESLRKEFEARAETMRHDYQELKQKYELLEAENTTLRNKIQKLEER
jgi:hypothetical protein